MDQTAADDLIPRSVGPMDTRRAVVDLGSNSVRLVIYEGENRNPVQIFNEKAVLRLAKGMTRTGQLDAGAMQQAETVLRRYAAIARAMGASLFEVLATSAVRDAENGPEFVRLLMERLPDLRVSVLTGHQEAILSAEGVLCGIPGADGVLADLGGGSLELVRLDAGRVAEPRRCRSASSAWPTAPAAIRSARAPSSRRRWRKRHSSPPRPGGTCTSPAARFGRWPASTSRRPATRSTWCITIRSAARRLGTWLA